MINSLEKLIYERQTDVSYRTTLQRFHIDGPLLFFLLATLTFGLTILYSASDQNYLTLWRQSMRIGIGLGIMFIVSQISAAKLRTFTPVFFGISIVLIAVVLFHGHVGKGAQRWLNIGLFRFQPSELLKVSLPLMLASYLHDRALPPNLKTLLVTIVLIVIPTLMVAKQPDLGTALLIMGVGASVLVFAGVRWQILLTILFLVSLTIPIVWHFLHNYQRARVLTFLYPESNPLGSGYHIIQSKIAIGSGGLFGKGWLKGTQSQLHFLPEHATDFIFAVCGEEFGFVGCMTLLGLYVAITCRGLLIATKAQDSFARLSAASLTISFFLSATINIGMVAGVLPVVGLPLPLISYGGSSIITLLASFGVLMSIHCHRKLLG